MSSDDSPLRNFWLNQTWKQESYFCFSSLHSLPTDCILASLREDHQSSKRHLMTRVQKSQLLKNPHCCAKKSTNLEKGCHTEWDLFQPCFRRCDCFAQRVYGKEGKTSITLETLETITRQRGRLKIVHHCVGNHLIISVSTHYFFMPLDQPCARRALTKF